VDEQEALTKEHCRLRSGDRRWRWIPYTDRVKRGSQSQPELQRLLDDLYDGRIDVVVSVSHDYLCATDVASVFVLKGCTMRGVPVELLSQTVVADNYDEESDAVDFSLFEWALS